MRRRRDFEKIKLKFLCGRLTQLLADRSISRESDTIAVCKGKLLLTHPYNKRTALRLLREKEDY